MREISAKIMIFGHNFFFSLNRMFHTFVYKSYKDNPRSRLCKRSHMKR